MNDADELTLAVAELEENIKGYDERELRRLLALSSRIEEAVQDEQARRSLTGDYPVGDGETVTFGS